MANLRCRRQIMSRETPQPYYPCEGSTHEEYAQANFLNRSLAENRPIRLQTCLHYAPIRPAPYTTVFKTFP